MCAHVTYYHQLFLPLLLPEEPDRPEEFPPRPPEVLPEDFDVFDFELLAELVLLRLADDLPVDEELLADVPLGAFSERLELLPVLPVLFLPPRDLSEAVSISISFAGTLSLVEPRFAVPDPLPPRDVVAPIAGSASRFNRPTARAVSLSSASYSSFSV
jgi:hypothetical protein